MQRTFGAPPVTLLLFALFLFIVHTSVTLFCVSQIGSLTQEIHRGQAKLAASTLQKEHATTPVPLDETDQDALSLRRLSSNSGWLAGYKEVLRALIWLYLVTLPTLVGSIFWTRDPRCS